MCFLGICRVSWCIAQCTAWVHEPFDVTCIPHVTGPAGFRASWAPGPGREILRCVSSGYLGLGRSGNLKAGTNRVVYLGWGTRGGVGVHGGKHDLWTCGVEWCGLCAAVGLVWVVRSHPWLKHFPTLALSSTYGATWDVWWLSSNGCHGNRLISSCQQNTICHGQVSTSKLRRETLL